MIKLVGLLRVKTQDVEALEQDSDRNGWSAQSEGTGCSGTRVRH